MENRKNNKKLILIIILFLLLLTSCGAAMLMKQGKGGSESGVGETPQSNVNTPSTNTPVELPDEDGSGSLATLEDSEETPAKDAALGKDKGGSSDVLCWLWSGWCNNGGGSGWTPKPNPSQPSNPKPEEEILELEVDFGLIPNDGWVSTDGWNDEQTSSATSNRLSSETGAYAMLSPGDAKRLSYEVIFKGNYGKRANFSSEITMQVYSETPINYTAGNVPYKVYNSSDVEYTEENGAVIKTGVTPILLTHKETKQVKVYDGRTLYMQSFTFRHNSTVPLSGNNQSLNQRYTVVANKELTKVHEILVTNMAQISYAN